MANQNNIRELVIDRFNSGFNCAESILRSFSAILNLELSDSNLQIATGFGGGIGRAGCICGALTGSIMVISLLQDGENGQQSRDLTNRRSGDFHLLFTDTFGTSCCRVLNPYPFATSEQRGKCQKIIGDAAELLIRFLIDEGITKV